MRQSKKPPRRKDPTSIYLSGEMESDDREESKERFGSRSKDAQKNKTERTSIMRAAADDAAGDIEALPRGIVMQVYSLFQEVEIDGAPWLCVVRKTLANVSKTGIVVGDVVRVRGDGLFDDRGRPQGVIERVEPRRTVLTRVDSFKQQDAHPIVANADQMLIVISLREPRIKWGLIDRMIVAAQSGKLSTTICLNKIDLIEPGAADLQVADQRLAQWQTLGVSTIRTSALLGTGIDAVRQLLHGKITVLAGHSGAGKSSLISAVQPGLDLRIGRVSEYTQKGRHTTTSARRYALAAGGYVIDTPGVKQFGLWDVTRENLSDFFPDVAAGTAADWRKDAYQQIYESLPR